MTLEHWEIIGAIIGTFAASSGFWAFLEKYRNKNTSRDKLLIGIAHDRIMYLSKQYIRRKYITQEEYENLHDYLYVPYSEMGGNGTAKKMMEVVETLPVRTSIFGEKNETQ